MGVEGGVVPVGASVAVPDAVAETVANTVSVSVIVAVPVTVVGSNITAVGFSSVGFPLTGLPLSTIESSLTAASAVPVASTSMALAVCVATKLGGSTTKVHPFSKNSDRISTPMAMNFSSFFFQFIDFTFSDFSKDFEWMT